MKRRPDRHFLGLMWGPAVLGILLVLFQTAYGAQTSDEISHQTMGTGIVFDSSESFGYGVTAQLIDQPIVPLLNVVTAMHFNWIRQPIHWSDIEPQPGIYHWDGLDPVVENAGLRRINLLLVVSGTPEWARPIGSDLSLDGPPEGFDSFSAFITELATRYAGRVAAFQIWDEPNSRDHWQRPLDVGLDNTAPEEYVQLLRTAFRVVKLVSPNSLIISAGLATQTGGCDGTIEELDFYRRMAQVGGAMWQDGLALQVDGDDFLSSSFDGAMVQNRIDTIRTNVNAYTDMPVWLTQVGWGSENIDSSNPPDEMAQTAFLKDAIQMALADSTIRVLVIDNLNFALVDPAGPESGSSLLRSDWSTHAAIDSLAKLRQAELVGSSEIEHHARARSPQCGCKPYVTLSGRIITRMDIL